MMRWPSVAVRFLCYGHIIYTFILFLTSSFHTHQNLIDLVILLPSFIVLDVCLLFRRRRDRSDKNDFLIYSFVGSLIVGISIIINPI